MKKYLVSVFVLSFLMTSGVSAATVSELRAMIESLTRQVQALQKNTGSSVGSYGQQANVTSGDIDPEGDSTCVKLNYNLRYQMRDAQVAGEVSILQDFLQSEGYLKSSPTGYFGLSTLKAVKNFQSAGSIAPTGFVGPSTRLKISAKTGCGNTSVAPVVAPATPTNAPVYPIVEAPKVVAPSVPAVSVSGPTLSSISPNSGKVGAVIYVYGSNFNSNTYVAFDGNNIPIWPANSPGAGSSMFSFAIPAGTASGVHYLQVGEKGSNFPLTNSVILTVGEDIAQPPKINSLSTYSAVAGSLVYVYGNNFPVDSKMHFDSQTSLFTVNVKRINDATLSFVVPASLSVGGHAVQVKGEKSGSIISNATSLTVTSPASEQKYIKINSPTDYTTWTVGDNQTIRWTSTGYSGGSSGYIELSGTGARYRIAENIPNTGSYNWSSVGSMGANSFIPPGEYSLKVIMDGVGDIIGPLNIVAKSQSVTITSPLRGTTWNIGESKEFRWSTSNVPSNASVFIDLINNGVRYQIINSGGMAGWIYNTGSFTWNSVGLSNGTPIPPGTYTVQIVIVDGLNRIVDTEESITLVVVQPAEPVSVTQPSQTQSVSTTSRVQQPPAVSKNSGFEGPIYNNGETNKKIASFVFTSPDNTQMSIGSVGLTKQVSMVGLKNLKVMVNGSQVGDIRETVGEIEDFMLFTSYMPITVPAYASKVIDVYADITGPTTAGTYSSVIALKTLSANYESPWGTFSLPSLVSGQSITVK